MSGVSWSRTVSAIQAPRDTKQRIVSLVVVDPSKVWLIGRDERQPFNIGEIDQPASARRSFSNPWRCSSI